MVQNLLAHRSGYRTIMSHRSGETARSKRFWLMYIWKTRTAFFATVKIRRKK